MGQREDCGLRIANFGFGRAEDRGRRSEVRDQRTENRGQLAAMLSSLCVDRLQSCQPDTPVRIFGNSGPPCLPFRLLQQQSFRFWPHPIPSAHCTDGDRRPRPCPVGQRAQFDPVNTYCLRKRLEGTPFCTACRTLCRDRTLEGPVEGSFK